METLSWSQQRVPMYGEERFWDFSYGRLELRAYEDVRILLQARDVTDAVRKQHETEVIANEAARRATLHQEGHEAFHALVRLVERVAEGDTSHPGSLALLKSALGADSVMSWTLEGSSWHPVAMTGGQVSDWLLARPGQNDPHGPSSDISWERYKLRASCRSRRKKCGRTFLLGWTRSSRW